MALGDSALDLRSVTDLRRRLEAHQTLTIVLGITAVALMLRLVFLGTRIAHFDEARVGYWAMHFLESGEFHYRYIIHGPLVQHVNTWVFELAGANDFTMRLPVALIGGLLPASIILFRKHLRSSEMIGAAIFLAFNPILLYYSRFFRSTLPAIAFAFVAFGLLVRLFDTRNLWYGHVAVAFVALSFTAKENAIVYLLVWVGAGALLLDHTLFRHGDDQSGLDVVTSFFQKRRSTIDARMIGRVLGHFALASFVFGSIILFFYAPRAGSTGGIDFWQSLTTPRQLPALIDVTIHGSTTYPRQPGILEGYQYWLGGGIETGQRHDTIIDRYLTFLGVAMRAIGEYAAPLVVLAILGFLAERYATSQSRYVVLFTFYWGFVSLLGFPLGSDIANAWINVNGLVPFAVPAGIGLALVYRWGRGALQDRERVVPAVATIIVLLVVVSMSHGMATAVYTNDQSESNSLVQYAQPADPIRPTLEQIRVASTDTDGMDILFYGSGVVAGEKTETVNTMYPACSKMVKVLPMPWYIAMYDAEAGCALRDTLDDVIADEKPPVVITKAPYSQPVQDAFGSYEARTYHLRALGGQTTFLIDPAYVASNTSST